MKWIALIVALGILVPLIASKAAKDERVRRAILLLIGFDLFNPSHINIISDENYRGDSRGIEITTVDLLVLTLLIAQRKRKIVGPRVHPFLAARILYLLAFGLSLIGTPDLLRSSYSVWKLLRMFFEFSVLATAFAELNLVRMALTGLALGAVSQSAMALYQKYVWHYVRVIGSQSHPNSLAMIMNLISPVALSLMLAGRSTRIAGFVFLGAGMCQVFSLSRGGMMMFVLATVLTLGMSSLHGITSRKVRIVGVMILGAVIGLAKSLDTIIKRFTEAPKESEQARVLFNRAARAMANDHPFGIGVNMYSQVLDHGGYADMMGIDPGDRNGIAHHIYWLTAAELGYLGLAAYLFLLASVLIRALTLIRMPNVRGYVAIGIAAGLIVTYTQGTAEWIARQTTMSYCFWMYAAIIAAFMNSRRSTSPQ